RFLAKAGIEAPAGTIYLEDVMKEFGRFARLRTYIAARLLPAAVINHFYVERVETRALATVIFSSGSTGIPKGVMLTHENILANVSAIGQVYELKCEDVLIGVLPFFHSFGFTGTIWLPLLIGFGVVYHANPLDAKTIGELA